MSIFKLKEWWGTTVGAGEEFDVGSLVCGNLDNSEDKASTKIAVGSFSGILRVYNPAHAEFSADDLILEEDLNVPILQLCVGQFMDNTDDTALAVLHPRKLTVYELRKIELDDDNGSTVVYNVDRHYEHKLGIDGQHFSAFSMSCGNFGRGSGQDMILVQSMDGKLQLFEGHNLTLTRQFVDCLFPGPMEYIPSLDAFVTVNTAREAQCIRYRVLVSSQANISDSSTTSNGGNRGDDTAAATTGSFGLSAMRSSVMEWSSVIGEHCLFVLPGVFGGVGGQHHAHGGGGGTHASTSAAAASASNGDRGAAGGAQRTTHTNKERTSSTHEVDSEVMLVAESGLYLLSDGGRLIGQRKLEQTPVCACSYYSGTGYLDNVVIATQERSLLVLSEMCLVWAAQLDSVPVSVSIRPFGGNEGMICTIDEQGRLAVSFLGTRPPSSIASSAASRDLDYSQIDQEHQQLLNTIREQQSEAKKEPKDKLILRTQVARELDLGTSGPETDVDMPDNLVTLGDALVGVQSEQLLKVCVRLFIAYSGRDRASDVSVSVSAPSFCHVVPKSCALSEVKANSTPQLVRLYLYASKEQLAQDLTAEVCVSYQAGGHGGEPRVASHSFQVPLFLACCLRPAVKAATHKFTLDTGALPVHTATTLFEDLLVASHEAGVDVEERLGHTEQAIGLQLWAGYGSSNIDGNGIDGDGGSTEQLGLGLGSPEPALVSILVSKNSGRYRVQSDSLPALAMVLTELRRRLEALFPDEKEGGVVTCTDALPLDALFTEIDAHLAARYSLQASYSELNDLSHMYRVVEKRLLTRFKEKNAAALGGLDKILNGTYSKITAAADRATQAQNELSLRHTGIDGCVRVLVALAGMRLGLPHSSLHVLLSYLCPSLLAGTGSCSGELEGTGWEEMTESTLTYLLKTAVAGKEEGQYRAPSTRPGLPADTSLLKQRITLLFSKLEEGATLE